MTFLRRFLKRWCCLFTCLTTRAVHIEVAQSLDTKSCLAAVTIFISRRGYPSTIIGDNGKKFVGAANGLKAILNERDKSRIESGLAQKKIKPASTFWWYLGKTGSNLHESHDCNVGQPKTYLRGTEHNNVSFRENTQRKTPDSSKCRPFNGT